MKKNIKFSVIASLILTSIGLLVNLICSLIFKFAPFTLTISGGEAIEHVGFGIDFLEIFSMSASTESGGISTNVQFDLISLLVSFSIMFVVILVVKNIIGKIKKT